MMSYRQKNKWFPFLASALFLIFLAPGSPLAAQENLGRGRVTGTVVDEKGNPVEGALIVVDGVGTFYSWSEALAAKFAAGRTITVDIFGVEV